MPTPALHPDHNTLKAFGLGRLPDRERAEVEAHVASCDECCQELEKVGGDSLVGLAKAALQSPGSGEANGPPADVPAALLDHPRYKVLARLGAGGMGVVYKAEHKVMGRTVALKVLNPLTSTGPETAERFRREVRLASRLSHPNIITAHDADEAGGLHFLVMEYVDGMSLDRIVAKKGPLPVAVACHYARQAAIGLQHAVDQGMIHRDIKPHNIMVTRKGQVKVLDFGLARIVAGENDTSRTAASVTAPNLVVGTPDFLAPEQARNLPDLDHRADIYSLGCTLYFLLTGRPPFRGNNSFEKLIAHVQQEPEPVNSIRTEIPTGLVDVLNKMMAKNPDERFQKPSEVAAALLPFVKTGTPSQVAQPVTAEVVSAGPVLVPVPMPVADTVPNRGLMTPTPSVAVARSVVQPQPATMVFDNDSDEPEEEPERPTRRKKKKKRKAASGNRAALAAIVVAILAVPLMTWAGYKLLNPNKAKPQAVAAASTPSSKKVSLNPNGNTGTDTTEPAPEPNDPPPPPPDDPNFNPVGSNFPGPGGRPKDKRPGFFPGPGGRFPPQNPPQFGSERGARPGDWPKNILMVLPQSDLYYTDYAPVRETFEKAGVTVKTVSVTREPCTIHQATPGKPVKPDFAISEVTNEHLKNFSGVVFIGAGVDEFLPGGVAGKDARRIIDDMFDRQRLVCGICIGLKVLGEQGRLAGHRTAKSPFYDRPGIDWQSEGVVVDRSLVTGAADKNAKEFAERILEIMGASK